MNKTIIEILKKIEDIKITIDIYCTNVKLDLKDMQQEFNVLLKEAKENLSKLKNK